MLIIGSSGSDLKSLDRWLHRSVIGGEISATNCKAALCGEIHIDLDIDCKFY